jgi:hypothetical protein
MVEISEDAKLLLEPVERATLGGAHHLQRDVRAAVRVELFIHDAHATRAEPAPELISIEDRLPF